MNHRQLREELVRNVHYAVLEKFQRDTGGSVKCYVTDDLTAVTGEYWTPEGMIRFNIPVTVTFEPSGRVAMGPTEAMESERRER